ncbi:tetratricopeptide repeat protein [Kamptonema sp. UHCC 0994]|uniref:WD40 domain-containing protein n=1 Tax=Kamptonema sp. UHCC 0994 TaxID=3031329 RepID=UPI0023BADA5B|nr:tetratricopeptide repeat protein [Kamptonema sp. UHCC 0994]MDF0556731.1 DUF3808 domain-containing protein [Kamptonema sp. UHCC 0994]
MDLTTVAIVLLANLTQKLKTLVVNKTHRICQLVFTILLTFILAITGIAIPGITIRSAWADEVPSLNQILSLKQVKDILRTSKNIASTFISTITSGSSFFPDVNLNNNGNILLGKNTTNNSLLDNVNLYSSLIGGISLLNLTGSSFGIFNFFVTIKEFNFIQINVSQDKELYEAVKVFNQGVEAAKVGDYSKALSYYSEALKLDNNFAEAFASRGRAYSELGDDQINLPIIEEAKAFKSQHFALDNYSSALKATPKFVANQNSYVEPLVGRALVYIKLGDFQSAFNDLTEAINRNPEYYDAYLARAPIYLVSGDVQNAIKDLNSALSKYLDYPVAFIMRGSILGEKGEYKAAIKDFTKAIESKQQDAENYRADAYYKRGLAYLNLKQYQKAIDDFKEATKRSPNYVEAYYNWAVALANFGKYPEAINKCNQVIKLNPNYNQISNQSCIPMLSLNHSGVVAGVQAVAISPDGKIIASGSDDSTIKLWDIKTGKELKTFSHPSSLTNNSIQSIAFNPNGKIIASGSSDSTVKVWDITTGEEIKTEQMKHSNQVTSIAFSRDGEVIASSGNDKTIKLWDWKTGKNILTFPAQSNEIKSLAFSPVDEVIASGGCDKNVKLWNWKKGKEFRTLEGHKECVRAFTFSPDSQILASGSDDNNIIIWNWRTGKPIDEIFGHTDNVTALAFSPDGKTLASASDDKTIRLWDVETGMEMRVFFGHQSYVESVAFSPDGKTLVSGSYDKTVKVWQIP